MSLFYIIITAALLVSGVITIIVVVVRPHKTKEDTISITALGATLIWLSIFCIMDIVGTPAIDTTTGMHKLEGTVQFGQAIIGTNVTYAKEFIRNSMKDGAGDLDTAYALDVIANRLYAERTIGVFFSIHGFVPYDKLDKYQQARCKAYLQQL